MESTPFYIRDQRKRASIATIIKSPFYYDPRVMGYFLTTPHESEWIFENHLSGKNENVRAYRNMIGKRFDVETNQTSLTNRFTIRTTLSDILPIHHKECSSVLYLVIKIFVPCDPMHKNTRIDNIIYTLTCGSVSTENTDLVSSDLKGNSLWLMIRCPIVMFSVCFDFSMDIDINEIMIRRL